MQASTKMQQVIGQLAAKHTVDLTRTGAYLRLEMPNFDRLSIENIGQHRVSVAHYFEQHGDLVADPEIVFYTCDQGWYPIEITQVWGGWRPAARLEATGHIEAVNLRGQAEVARFATTWARNIQAQGWLERGILTGRREQEGA